MPSASAWRARRKDSLKGRIMRIQEKDLRFTAAGLFFKNPLTNGPDMLEWTYGGTTPVPNQLSLLS